MNNGMPVNSQWPINWSHNNWDQNQQHNIHQTPHLPHANRPIHHQQGWVGSNWNPNNNPIHPPSMIVVVVFRTC
jgi:hypothetical protein